MKKLIPIVTLLCLFSCGESGNSYEQVTSLKTISQRVADLNKSSIEIKELEEKAALSKQDNDYLEYEYPIREDEMYVVSYRFDDAGCFEIGLDTYFNQPEDAQNVVDGITKDLSLNKSFETPSKEKNIYRWMSVDKAVSIELDFQHAERGMISVTLFANK
ncbi:MAG: hypothetical protein J5I47_04315 [Vicingus serpentipes]|nr:hypothetical protein [Vicingus serpentipes]